MTIRIVLRILGAPSTTLLFALTILPNALAESPAADPQSGLACGINTMFFNNELEYVGVELRGMNEEESKEIATKFCEDKLAEDMEQEYEEATTAIATARCPRAYCPLRVSSNSNGSSVLFSIPISQHKGESDESYQARLDRLIAKATENGECGTTPADQKWCEQMIRQGSLLIIKCIGQWSVRGAVVCSD